MVMAMMPNANESAASVLFAGFGVYFGTDQGCAFVTVTGFPQTAQYLEELFPAVPHSEQYIFKPPSLTYNISVNRHNVNGVRVRKKVGVAETVNGTGRAAARPAGYLRYSLL
jgi:hypothetical protein